MTLPCAALTHRGGGSISHLAFKSISVSTRLSDPSAWWGAAEPIYATALPRAPGVKARARRLALPSLPCPTLPSTLLAGRTAHPSSASPPPQQVGAVFDVSFTDVHAISENGVFLAGGPLGILRPGQRRPPRPFSISAIRLTRVTVDLVKRSDWPGGCRDYRPSAGVDSTSAAEGWWPAGLDCSEGGTAPIYVAGVQQVTLTDVTVRHGEPARPNWRRTAWIDPFNTWSVIQHRVDVS